MSPFTCRECGEPERPSAWSDGAQLARAQLCRRCHYWHEAIALAADPRSVRVRGVHWFIGAEDERGTRGFGGRRFRVRFLDGREALTSNLWHQGEIPARFRDRLPDNAAEVTEP